MTAVAVVSAVRERLVYLDSDESTLPGYWKHEVARLISQLAFIENFLKNPSCINNDLDKQAVLIAYDVEDAVESGALQQDDASSTTTKAKKQPKYTGRFKSIFKSPSPTMTHHKYDDDYRSLKRRMDELLEEIVHHKRDAEKEISRFDHASCSSSLHQLQPIVENLEMKEDFESLYWLLLNDDERFPEPTIWIQGTAGIGKTTIARKLFDDPSVVMHFDRRAWVHVGQDFQARDIAAAILMNLSSSGSIKVKMETTQLMEQLYKAQKGRRCLVVLDNVWSADAWDTIRFAFPLDHGTKILITTRIRNIASQAGMYMHPLRTLNNKQHRKLSQKFKKHSGAELPDQEDVAKKIFIKCRGHTLSVAVLFGMLRGKKLEDWLEVYYMLQDYKRIIQMPLPALVLSYNHLPFQLKSCFLYLGCFPCDQVIPVEKLYLLWLAEGLVPANDQENKTRMDIAEDLLRELVERSLVMVQKEDFSGTRKFKSCEIHDLIHEFCMTRGAEEGFFGVVDYRKGEEWSLMRRTAIYVDTCRNKKDEDSLNISEPKHIRSILFFGTDGPRPKSAWPRKTTDLKEYERVRVLDFDRVDFRIRTLPKGIEKLLYLRYLSFRGCYLEELPSCLSNFSFLETLDLCVRASCKMIIPNILRSFSCLRHLYFPLVFQSTSNNKLKLDGLTRLEILENFNSDICDADDLKQLENLQILKGTVYENDDDLSNVMNFIQRNEHLRHSSLTVKNYDCYTKERLSIVKRLLKCDALHALNIEGHLGTLPRALGSGFTRVAFDGSEFSEDPMPILGKLPNLRSLELCDGAFVGKEMECAGSDFPKLRNLKLASLWSLEKWVVETEAMPRLSSLTVEKCNKLQELPEELMDIETLQDVKIGSMSQEFQAHVRGMAEEQRSFGNDLLRVTFYD